MSASGDAGAADAHIRPLEARDALATGTLLDAAFDQSPYFDRAREVTDAALGAYDREHRALVAERAHDLVGIVVYGDLLGSDRVMRVHFLALASREHVHAGRQLLHAVHEAARRNGARFVFTEIADDPLLRDALRLYGDVGYSEEARIADYVRDGVALLFLRRSV